MICIIYAHPYPDRSRANRAMLASIGTRSDLALRSLYELYPDFAIDVEAEQAALARARLIVLQHPFYWYSVPGLLKHWFDKVLTLGWAYGPSGDALRGKTCWWVTTTGANEQGYTPSGMHERPFADFVPPIEQTARFCGMRWADPLIVHGAHRISPAELAEAVSRYRARFDAVAAEVQEST